MAAQGLITFPGIAQILGFRMSFSDGYSPSLCSVDLPPETNLPSAGGTLSIVYDGLSVSFVDCRVDKLGINRTAGGRVATVTIADRRWKWKFGTVTATFNRRLSDESIDPDTESTPQQIAQFLLNSKGETGYDVSALPNSARPEVEYVAANPMQSLDQLANELGCRLSIRLTPGNPVRIVRSGFGATLPAGGDIQMTDGVGIDPPERPERIVVVGGEIRYQVKFKLEAVGLDNDGSVKVLDQLSYTPSGGWENEYPASFFGVNEEDRPLAFKTVWKWYRIVDYAHEEQVGEVLSDLPEFDVEKILPLESELIDTFEEGGETRPSPPKVEGAFYNDHGSMPTWSNTDDGTAYDGQFRIKGDVGIVEFQNTVYQYHTETRETLDAELYLTAVFSHGKYIKDRFEKEKVLAGGTAGTGELVLRHEEIVQTFVARYDEENQVASVENNTTSVNSESDHYLDAKDVELQATETNDISYPRILAIEVDGAVKQVSWQGGASGATTRASRNTEHDFAIPSYNQRRRSELTDTDHQAPGAAEQVRRASRRRRNTW